MGPCSSAYFYARRMHNDIGMTFYTERCCVIPGKHILSCIGSPYKEHDNRGWNAIAGAFLEIQGHKYCDDTITYNAMQMIDVVGANILLLYNTIRLLTYYSKSNCYTPKSIIIF